jgi:SAM-dependent methyltransferase
MARNNREMTQKQIWIKEYEEQQNLPSSRTDHPSRALVEFFETGYAKEISTALDAGCGKGRNSFYLEQNGVDVTGIDFVPSAITSAQEAAHSLGLTSKTHFLSQSIAKSSPLQAESIDLVIDMMSLHTLRNTERIAYVTEVARVLRHEGYFVFYTIASDSPAAQALFKTSPGEEPNSYIIPQNGAFEKGFSREDIQAFFPHFDILKFERKVEFTPAFGDVYERVYYSGILRKLQ